jgi:hypothetical protein
MPVDVEGDCDTAMPEPPLHYFDIDSLFPHQGRGSVSKVVNPNAGQICRFERARPIQVNTAPIKGRSESSAKDELVLLPRICSPFLLS